MNILVVDDDKIQNKILVDELELYNKKNNSNITLDIAEDLQSGLNKLRSQSYNGAIVDLRLRQNDYEGEGNQILAEIKSKLRFPVRIISGNLGDLEPQFDADSYLFKKSSRGDVDYDEMLSEFNDIFTTGITDILNNRGLIESNINNIFWTHLSEILPTFVQKKRDFPNWNCEKVLLRYISTHIQEYLELSIDNNLEPVEDIEFYIKPPVKTKIFTGDIIRFKNDRLGIILTPACDLATDSRRIVPKADYITIAIIENFNSITDNKNSGEIGKLKSNNSDLKYHYLPQTTLCEGGFINFQNLISIEIKENSTTLKDLSELFAVECVITNPFRKDIISRFANYFSRQGQPSFN
jgi:CheY-like chemotaxis protein